MFSRPFRKMEWFPWPHTMRIYKKGDTVDIKRMGTAQKGMPANAPTAKRNKSTVGIVGNEQAKDKIRAQRSNVRIGHLEHSSSRDSP